MSFWVVYGMDEIFQGYHGMNIYEIFDGSENDALNYAKELSVQVISDYSQIYEELEEQVREECDFQEIDYDSDEAEAILNEVYNEDLLYGAIELNKEVLPTLNEEELDRLLNEDPDEFIEKYRLN